MRPRDEEFALEIGARLKRARRKAGMSQEDLARAAELHRTTIGLIENGKREMQSGTLLKLLGALEVDPRDVLDGIEFIPGPPKTEGTWSFLAPEGRQD